MSKRSKHIDVSGPLYNMFDQNIFFIGSVNMDYVTNKIREFINDPKFEVDVEPTDDGMTWRFKNKQTGSPMWVTWINSEAPKAYRTMYHECEHIAIQLFDYVGQNILEGQESFNYFVSSLVDQIIYKYKNDNKQGIQQATTKKTTTKSKK